MRIGLLWKSFKENERRYPLHAEHIKEININVKDNVFFEEGYPLGDVSVPKINIKSRKEIFETCDLVILPKPTEEDYDSFREGQTIMSWAHAVQGREITEVAIKKRLTLISWENMYIWNAETKKEHIFSRNNELAGYSSILHFMQLNGITPGAYGKDIKVAVLGFGSTAKGAINALLGLGATDITVFSRRSKYQLVDAIKNVKYGVYSTNGNDVLIDGVESGLALNKYDLIVNCILQDPIHPIVFLKESGITEKKISIVDISCDKGMGFDFAVPTSFVHPIIETEKYIYYSVDHTPSYFWNSASYEISGALLPYLNYLLVNNTYKGNVTLERAVDIEKGFILNKAILKFQKRKDEYPYSV